MGNRAVITTEERRIGVYLHEDGGRNFVEALLTYCRMRNFPHPSGARSGYGWACLCTVYNNFVLDRYKGCNIDLYEHMDTDNGDNGTYVIKGWEIVKHEHGYLEPDVDYDKLSVICVINSRQPEYDRLEETRINKLYAIYTGEQLAQYAIQHPTNDNLYLATGLGGWTGNIEDAALTQSAEWVKELGGRAVLYAN